MTGTASEPLPAVRLEGVQKVYGHSGERGGGIDLSLVVERGSFLAILGPSGSGKTTLLRLVGGLLQPDSGRVSVFGERPLPGKQAGFVFQSFRLLPWQTVAGNVGLPLRARGMRGADLKEAVLRQLSLVGLERVAEHYPHQLSGGMRQRAALARALTADPEILLMDEPFASLDAYTRELLQAELLELWRTKRRTVLYVTHSIDEAITLADRIILIGGRPGRLIADITVTDPRRPGMQAANALRKRLSEAMRALVVSDPDSDFYGRTLPPLTNGDRSADRDIDI